LSISKAEGLPIVHILRAGFVLEASTGDHRRLVAFRYKDWIL
jgi:hypothetical protein